MGLVVEHEHVRRRPLLRIGRRLVHFDGADLEERFAQCLFGRDEGRDPPARALEELSPADPEIFRGVSASSFIRNSTSSCYLVCGYGRYSPFEIIRVGTGD